MTYPKRTSRGDVAVDGVTFRSWQVGIAAFALKSVDARLCVALNYRRTTYSAIVDGKVIGERYRTEKAACLAAVKALYFSGDK